MVRLNRVRALYGSRTSTSSTSHLSYHYRDFHRSSRQVVRAHSLLSSYPFSDLTNFHDFWESTDGFKMINSTLTLHSIGYDLDAFLSDPSLSLCFQKLLFSYIPKLFHRNPGSLSRMSVSVLGVRLSPGWKPCPLSCSLPLVPLILMTPREAQQSLQWNPAA